MYHGIDFSGAARPGDDIWLASARPTGDGLRLDACQSASERFDTTGREAVLDALRAWLADVEGVAGLDVSFGLPRVLVPADASESWRAFLRWFAATFADADGKSMQAALKQRARASDADGIELKRLTDGPTGASSPYSFITRYQTLHGIRDVLAPLVLDGQVSVEPMAPSEGPTLCEIYPAATLGGLGLPDEQYKGNKHDGERARREQIVAGLREWGVAMDDALAARLVDESGGDALDAVVGTVAVARAVEDDFAVEEERYDPLEGYIYA
ncbi:DUF429 domain-containing protein [Halosegnis longus]|uniref:DUF429 domain-containing protein n=1 Tax=Halosegnis longus TaxID=2216012 RepID=A0AAJ4UW55_9EURY|nr:DUF429 domain-containing protein [Halosegnis longus]RNJ26722.1 DUF429 domain-containing protein [Salella cibi]